ncbi:MAG: DMT family transporter [Bryobacterales bacterium]|nr:DMT family transporter [Bryobacterales bacterium]
MNPARHNSAWRAELALLAVVAIWGATFVLVKAALADASTLLFLALRFGLGTLVLGLVFLSRLRGVAAPKRSLAAGVLAGLCLFGGYFFQTSGLRYTSPSRSAFITALSVVMVPLLVSLVHKSAPHASEWAGVALATAGLGVMTLERGNLALNRGDLLTLVCAAAFALHILALGHYAGKVSVELLSLGQVATTALIAAGTFWWAETPRVCWSPGLAAALAVTGVLATALAFTVQTWAQRHSTPTRAALIIATEPVFAWVASLAVSAERFSARGLAGGLLILSGVILAELKPSLAGKHPLR